MKYVILKKGRGPDKQPRKRRRKNILTGINEHNIAIGESNWSDIQEEIKRLSTGFISNKKGWKYK